MAIIIRRNKDSEIRREGREQWGQRLYDLFIVSSTQNLARNPKSFKLLLVVRGDRNFLWLILKGLLTWMRKHCYDYSIRTYGVEQDTTQHRGPAHLNPSMVTDWTVDHRGERRLGDTDSCWRNLAGKTPGLLTNSSWWHRPHTPRSSGSLNDLEQSTV